MQKFDIPTLIITCGLPASGKSSWSILYAQTQNFKYASRDHYRYLLWDTDIEHYFNNEKEVEDLYYSFIVLNLVDGFSVIADATHLTKGSIAKLLNRCHIKHHEDGFYLEIGSKKIPIDVWLKIFDADVETCIERNKYRSGFYRIPEETIRNMNSYKKFPSDGMGKDGWVHLIEARWE